MLDIDAEPTVIITYNELISGTFVYLEQLISCRATMQEISGLF